MMHNAFITFIHTVTKNIIKKHKLAKHPKYNGRYNTLYRYPIVTSDYQCNETSIDKGKKNSTSQTVIFNFYGYIAAER